MKNNNVICCMEREYIKPEINSVVVELEQGIATGSYCDNPSCNNHGWGDGTAGNGNGNNGNNGNGWGRDW